MTRTPRRLLAAAAAAALIAACDASSSSAPTPGSTASGPRPSTSAMVEILQPTSGATITGNTVHIVLKLTGAQIVTTTSTNIRPDQGHIHLYVDNNLVSMNYGTEQDLPVQPGTYVLKAEFVASDHAPFNPRVWSPEVFFTVK